MSDMPTFIPPMLATLVGAPFDDPDWSFEVKWDGFRVEAVVVGDEVRLWTRGLRVTFELVPHPRNLVTSCVVRRR